MTHRPILVLSSTLLLPLLLACPSEGPQKPPRDESLHAGSPAEGATPASPATPKTDAAATPETPEPKLGEAPPEAPARTFKKGMPAPRGLTPEEIKAYAVAQGDPAEGVFSLEQAFEGDPQLSDRAAGKLTATFDTTLGTFACELYEDKAPLTVANFVGLARGVRPALDPTGDTWTTKPFYDGLLFHRVIEDFMIQTGDPTGSGSGGPGYVIVDEFDDTLKHKGPGILSMANRGANTGSSQFFVTVADTPHLDGKHAIFGKCDAKVPIEISKVKVDPHMNRPYEQVKINTIAITRKR